MPTRAYRPSQINPRLHGGQFPLYPRGRPWDRTGPFFDPEGLPTDFERLGLHFADNNEFHQSPHAARHPYWSVDFDTNLYQAPHPAVRPAIRPTSAMEDMYYTPRHSVNRGFQPTSQYYADAHTARHRGSLSSDFYGSPYHEAQPAMRRDNRSASLHHTDYTVPPARYDPQLYGFNHDHHEEPRQPAHRRSHSTNTNRTPDSRPRVGRESRHPNVSHVEETPSSVRREPKQHVPSDNLDEESRYTVPDRSESTDVEETRRTRPVYRRGPQPASNERTREPRASDHIDSPRNNIIHNNVPAGAFHSASGQNSQSERIHFDDDQVPRRAVRRRPRQADLESSNPYA